MIRMIIELAPQKFPHVNFVSEACVSVVKLDVKNLVKFFMQEVGF